jgi:hypothetical protein
VLHVIDRRVASVVVACSSLSFRLQDDAGKDHQREWGKKCVRTMFQVSLYGQVVVVSVQARDYRNQSDRENVENNNKPNELHQFRIQHRSQALKSSSRYEPAPF